MSEPIQGASDRRGFLHMAALGAAGTVGVAAFGTDASAQTGGTAVPNLYPRINAREFAAIRDHENQHVAYLVNALGASARPKPNFKNLLQPNIKAFATTSAALENTGTGAYLGAAPVIFSKANLAAAGSILAIEARHSGYLNVLLNGIATTNIFGAEQVFERALTIAEVVASATPFIQDLNGGPPLTFNATPSKSNDVAILNFALALEYLEAEYYNLNIPRFFPS